jgi:phosphocarrier protein
MIAIVGIHMIEKQFVIKNKVGLHARPASKFVQLASKFKCLITVTHGSCEVNAKSILGVLTLGANQGSTITIRADGAEAVEAIAELSTLVDSNFGEVE